MIILLFLVSCYVPSHRVYNFETNRLDKIWLNGKELIKLNEGNIEIIVSFDQTRLGIVSFDLVIANNSDKRILIEPEKFYCLTIDRVKTEEKVYALDPEKRINKIDRKIEKLYAANSSANRTELLFSLFEIADTIYGKNESEEEKKQTEEDAELRKNNFEEQQKNNIYKINQFNNKRNLLGKQALRKTTLFPGQKMSGKLYFLLANDIRDLTLYFPIDNHTLELKYERKYFKKEK